MGTPLGTGPQVTAFPPARFPSWAVCPQLLLDSELSNCVLGLLHGGSYARLSQPLLVAGLSDEEDQKPVRLPLRVPVELQPRNNHAWARVQSLAQNPRLR